MPRLARRLGLSEKQKGQVAEILKAQNAACRPASERLQEELAQCRERALPEISTLLTPKQRAQLDRILRARGRAGLPPSTPR
jgi:Spy/CpxP family protein refolding chaperone